jgi:hypothetical protein
MHVVEPRVVAPEGINVQGVSPQTIEVAIAVLPTPPAVPTGSSDAGSFATPYAPVVPATTPSTRPSATPRP